MGIFALFAITIGAFYLDIRSLQDQEFDYRLTHKKETLELPFNIFDSQTTKADIPIEQVMNLPIEKIDVEENDFVVVVLPDTQHYLDNKGKYSYIFDRQIKFILENNESIASVIHVGDIVETYYSKYEWKTASEIMKQLDDNDIPYAILPGNHDMYNPLLYIPSPYPFHFIQYWLKYPDENDNYNIYFGPQRFRTKSWHTGREKDKLNNNNMIFFEAGDMEFMILSIEYCPTKETIEWANNMMYFYPEKRVIISTHAFIDENAERFKCSVIGSVGGDYIWNSMIINQEQIFLVVSGHCGSSGWETYHSTRYDKASSGNWVYQFFDNYQSLEGSKGGDGWLKLFIFKLDKDEIVVKTYSPFLNKYDEELEETIIYDMGAITTNINTWEMGEDLTVSGYDLEEE